MQDTVISKVRGTGSLHQAPAEAGHRRVFEGKQGREKAPLAALILQGTMCCNKGLSKPKNYLDYYTTAQLRGKTTSGRPGWTAPPQH